MGKVRMSFGLLKERGQVQWFKMSLSLNGFYCENHVNGLPVLQAIWASRPSMKSYTHFNRIHDLTK